MQHCAQSYYCANMIELHCRFLCTMHITECFVQIEEFSCGTASTHVFDSFVHSTNKICIEFTNTKKRIRWIISHLYRIVRELSFYNSTKSTINIANGHEQNYLLNFFYFFFLFFFAAFPLLRNFQLSLGNQRYCERLICASDNVFWGLL